MPFPTEINQSAVRQIARLVTGIDHDPGRATLAFYELVGFACGKIFPQATYVSDGLAQDSPFQQQLAAELSAADPARLKEILGKALEVLGPIALNALLKWLKV